MLTARLFGTGRTVSPLCVGDRVMTRACGLGLLISCIPQRRSSSGFVRHGGPFIYQDESAAVKRKEGEFPVVQQEAESSKLVGQEPRMQRDGLVKDSTVAHGKLSQAEAYQRYYQIPRNPRRFFQSGRVFAMLSIERWYGGSSVADESKVTTIAFGERVYHSFHNFVVVKQPMADRRFSYCSRINTFRDRDATGIAKSVANHATVYSGELPPERLPGEQKVTKDPLRVIMQRGKWLPRTQIDLGLLYPISFDTRVSYFGDMDSISVRKLAQYQKEVDERHHNPWMDESAPSDYHLQLDNLKN